jgi:transposase
MSKVTTLGIDLAKRVFELHGLDERGGTVLRRRLSRAQLPEFMVQLPPCEVVMEACGSAQYWARKFTAMGHGAKLIAPQAVKAYRAGQKNDANDAAAIAVAARAPRARFVALKSEEQQAVQALARIRARLVGERTALTNQVRGLLGEYGIVLNKGLAAVRRALPALGEEERVPAPLREALGEFYEELRALDARIKRYERRIAASVAAQPDGRRLMALRGVGVLSAGCLMAKLGDGSAWRNGRQFSASLGLVPRQNSSGERVRLGPITKRGDPELRRLLVHGARSSIRHLGDKQDADSRRLRALVERRGVNRAAVAWANRTARRAWALVRYERDYDPDYVLPEAA